MCAYCSGCGYNADSASFCLFCSSKGSRIYNACVRNRQVAFELFARNRTYRTAGGNNHFYIILKQKICILKSIFCNDFSASVSVGNSARIAEVYYIFIRQKLSESADSRQAAEAGIKYADGSVIHKLRLALVFTRESAVDELFKQLAVRGTGVFPELRVHADGREARQRVDLV